MLKINCPDCLKDFMWTDHMPLTGKCPTPGCAWQYDVHRVLKEGTSRRENPLSSPVTCPNCGAEIASRFSFCKGCSHLVTGPTTWGLSFLFILLAVIALIVSITLIQYKP